MQKQFYDRLAKPFETNEKKKKILLNINRIITRLLYLMYPALLVLLVVFRDIRWIPVLAVPAVSFVLVTIVRKLINAPRPYEVWDSGQVIAKDTKGKSFPSRHVFSVYIIAMAWLYVLPWVGILLLIIGVFLAWARVAGRVHFVKDVTAGAVIGIVLGWIGFWLIW